MTKRPTREIPAPRFNEVLTLRVGIIVSAIAALCLFGAVFFIQPGVKVLDRKRTHSARERDLVDILESLRTSWDPRQRERILAEAPRNAERFAGLLHRMLRIPDHRLLMQAVEYAGVLGAPGLRPLVVDLTRSRRAGVRTQAVRAAEQLAPWPTERLEEFLVYGITPVKLATLEIAAQRADAPWNEILKLLVHGDGELREAAVRAIPRRPPAAVSVALWDMVDRGELSEVIVGLQALARTELTDDTEARLAGILPRLDSEGQLVCLDALAAKGKRLAEAKAVWSLVLRGDVEVRVRARAFHCLEQTGSFEVEQVRSEVPTMDPMLRYCAARCLLSSGHEDGAAVLLDLLESDDDRAVLASRRLLAWLTGRSPATSEPEFRRTLSRNGRTLRRQLPAPALPKGPL